MITQGKKFFFLVSSHLVLACALLMFSPLNWAGERIGLVKTYEPHATAIRQGTEVNLNEGAEIFGGDTIVTDSNGAVGIIFSDGAVLTLGPSGTMVIENFLFNPADKQVSFVSKIIKGTIAYLSGAIGRIKPGSVEFNTPTATLGLRGTKVLIEVK